MKAFLLALVLYLVAMWWLLGFPPKRLTRVPADERVNRLIEHDTTQDTVHYRTCVTDVAGGFVIGACPEYP